MTPLGIAIETILISILATLLSIMAYIYVSRRSTRADIDIIVRMLQEDNRRLQEDNDLLRKRVDVIDGDHTRLREERMYDRAQLGAAMIELDTLYQGVRILIGQIEQGGAKPNWSPPQSSPSKRINSRAALINIIQTKFSIEEMKNLAYDVGIEYDTLPAMTAGPFARELVLSATRTGVLPDLIARIKELRPDLEKKSGQA